MSVHENRLKIIQFVLGGTSFDCQVSSWTVSAGIKTGATLYSFCAAGEGNNAFIEQTDGTPTLALKFYSDYRSAGISDYLWLNNMQTVAFTLDHHPDITGEHVQWSGFVQIQAPDAGGDARATEVQSVTLPIVGAIPTYTRIS